MLWVDDLLIFVVDYNYVIECIYNLFGVKGCGEVGVIGLFLIVVNVVVDVL